MLSLLEKRFVQEHTIVQGIYPTESRKNLDDGVHEDKVDIYYLEFLPQVHSGQPHYPSVSDCQLKGDQQRTILWRMSKCRKEGHPIALIILISKGGLKSGGQGVRTSQCPSPSWQVGFIVATQVGGGHSSWVNNHSSRIPGLRAARSDKPRI